MPSRASAPERAMTNASPSAAPPAKMGVVTDVPSKAPPRRLPARRSPALLFLPEGAIAASVVEFIAKHLDAMRYFCDGGTQRARRKAKGSGGAHFQAACAKAGANASDAIARTTSSACAFADVTAFRAASSPIATPSMRMASTSVMPMKPSTARK